MQSLCKNALGDRVIDVTSIPNTHGAPLHCTDYASRSVHNRIQLNIITIIDLCVMMHGDALYTTQSLHILNSGFGKLAMAGRAANILETLLGAN